VAGALNWGLDWLSLGQGDDRGTLKPYFMEMWPAARLIRSLGTK